MAHTQSTSGSSSSFLPLRFSDGDVLVKLSAISSQNPLLHSDMIKTAMPQLAPAFEERWNQADIVPNPVTGKEMKLYTLALHLTEGTVLLEGKVAASSQIISILANVQQDFVDVADGKSIDDLNFLCLYDTVLGTDGWPKAREESCATSFPALLADVSLAYRTLFAFVYGHPLTLANICPWAELSDEEEDRPWPPLTPVLQALTTLCAVAEYYGMLVRLAPVIAELVSAYPTFWQIVAKKPASWMRLAKKLRDKDIYLDAARHVLAGGDFDEIAMEFHGTVEEACSTFGSFLAKRDSRMTTTRNTLLRFGLTQQQYPFDGRPATAWTSFLHALSFRSADRAQAAKACERFDYLATSIFSEWVVKHVAVGQRLYKKANGSVRAADHPGLGYITTKLADAATWDCPAKLFGRGTPERYASIFKLGRTYSPADRIRTTLNDLVTSAAKYLDQALAPSHTVVQNHYWVVRRSRFDGLDERFTYLPLNEDELPGEDEAEVWEVNSLPDVNLEVAPVQLLRALKLFEDEEETVVGADIG